jgi:hypothetical protein
MTREDVFKEINTEMDRALANLPEDGDDNDTENDYIAYALAYLGRASRGVFRNEREKSDYKTNMIKAAGLIITGVVQKA